MKNLNATTQETASPADADSGDIALFDAITALAVSMDDLRVKKRLTLEATSMTRLGSAVLQIDGELEEIEMPSKGNPPKPQKAWAIAATDVVRGECYMVILNVVLVSAFRRAGAPLTGRYFAIRAGEVKAGKHYRSFEVVELERVS